MPEFRFQRTLLSATLGIGALTMASLSALASHHFHHRPPPPPPPAPPVHHHQPPPVINRPPTPPSQQIIEQRRMRNSAPARQTMRAASRSVVAIDDKVGDWSDFADLSEGELAVLFAEMMPESDGFNGPMVKGMLTQQIQLSDAPPDVKRQMLAGVDQMVSQMGTMVGMSMASFPQDMAREFKQIYAANCCGQAQFIAALGAAETKVANNIRSDFARGIALPPGLPPGMGAALAGNIAGGTTTITYGANDAEIRAAAAMVANGRPGGGTQVAGIPGGGGSNNAPPIPTTSVGGTGATGGTPQINTPPPGGNTPPPANTPQTPPTGGGQTGGGNVPLPPPNIPTTSVGGTGTTGGTPQIPTTPPGSGNTPPAPGGNTPPPGGGTVQLPPPNIPTTSVGGSGVTGGTPQFPTMPPGGNTLPPVAQINPGTGGTPPANQPGLNDLLPDTQLPEVPPLVLNPDGGGAGDTVPDAGGLMDPSPQGDSTIQDLGDPNVSSDVASSGPSGPTDQTAQVEGFGRHRDPDTIRDDIKYIVGQIETDPNALGQLRDELTNLNDELQNSVEYNNDTWLESDTAGFIIEHGGTVIDVTKVAIVGGACLTTGGACAAVIAAGGAFGTADKVAGVIGNATDSYNQRVNAGADGGLETIAYSTLEGAGNVAYGSITKTLGGKAGQTIGRKGELIKVLREEGGKALGGMFKDALNNAANRSSGGSDYSSANSLAYGSIGDPVVTRTGGTVYK